MSTSDEPRDIVTVAPSPIMESGTYALAALSDVEFESRIDTLKRQTSRVERIQRELMNEGVDYGVIPGTPKPTLYKAGAEKLTNFYRYAPAIRYHQRTIGDGISAPIITWDAVVALHLGSTDGPVVAEGVGTCNSWEKKYRYRTAERACPECGALKTIIKGKDEWERDPKFKGGWLCYGKKGGCGAKFVKDDPRIIHQQLGEIENPDPWDLDNTILKMAVKRGYVDVTLRGTATSGLFTQDLEDLPGYADRLPREEPSDTNGQSQQASSQTIGSQPRGDKRAAPVQPVGSTAPTPPPADGTMGLATGPQIAAIYALGAQRDWDDARVEKYTRDLYSKRPDGLTKREAVDCIKALQGTASAEESTPAAG